MPLTCEKGHEKHLDILVEKGNVFSEQEAIRLCEEFGFQLQEFQPLVLKLGCEVEAISIVLDLCERLSGKRRIRVRIDEGSPNWKYLALFERGELASSVSDDELVELISRLVSPCFREEWQRVSNANQANTSEN